MKIINLHGKIAEKFGARWELEVESIAEALRAIDANTGNFFDYLSENRQENKTFSFILDGCSQKIEREEELLAPLPRQCKEFHVIPNAEGATGLEAFFVNLIILLATSFIMRALFKPPKPEDEKRSRSFLFAGADNVTAQAIPVPLGYGRLLVGSVVVSSTMRHIDRRRVDSSISDRDIGGSHYTFANWLDTFNVNAINSARNISRYQNTKDEATWFGNSDPEGVFSLAGGEGGD